MRDPTQPSWQVKYSDYGGIKVYTMVKNTYWRAASRYISREGRYNATNFPIMGYEESVMKLLGQFRKDLLRPIRT